MDGAVTIRSVVIPVEGPIRALEYPGGRKDQSASLAALNKAVGGYIEALGVEFGEFGNLIMWLNETGKLDGLPRNERASILAHQVIAGDVVITGPVDDEGYETSLSDELVEAFVTSTQTTYITPRFVMVLTGHQGIERPGQPVPSVGQFLRHYDPDFNHGNGHAEWTPHLSFAQRFETKEEAWALWQAVPRDKPTRPDGRPNRPLTAFTISIVPETDFQGIDIAVTDGARRRSAMRNMRGFN